MQSNKDVNLEILYKKWFDPNNIPQFSNGNSLPLFSLKRIRKLQQENTIYNKYGKKKFIPFINERDPLGNLIKPFDELSSTTKRKKVRSVLSKSSRV